MEFYRVKDMVRRLQIGESTVWRWAREGKLPEPIRLGRRVTVWRKKDVEAFLDQAAAANQQR